MKEKLLKMMEELIEGNYDCNEFSYDFPEMLLDADEETNDLFEDLPEICAAFDPYWSGEEDALGEKGLIEAVKKVYDEIKQN